MMISFRRTIVLLVTVLILLSSGCDNYTKNNSEAEKFSQSLNVFADSINQLKEEQGINLTGLAGEQEKNLIKVGIGIDRNIISDARFKIIINKYIGNLPKEILEPYNLEIEEIDKEKGSSWLIAEKSANTTIINWILWVPKVAWYFPKFVERHGCNPYKMEIMFDTETAFEVHLRGSFLFFVRVLCLL